MSVALDERPADTETPLGLSIRPTADEDNGYILGSWSEAYKLSPANRGRSWINYKRDVLPGLRECLMRPDTTIVGAYMGPSIVGWIAFCRGKRVDVVHWVHTRFRVGADGERLRRRGIMATLWDACELSQRIGYTHLGGRPRHPGAGESTRRSDEWVCDWLRERAVVVTHIAYEEWKR